MNLRNWVSFKHQYVKYPQWLAVYGVHVLFSPPTPSFHPSFPLQRGMLYNRAAQYQEVDGQLQRYLVGCNQRWILDQQAVAQESGFSQKVTCAYTAPSTPGNHAFMRERDWGNVVLGCYLGLRSCAEMLQLSWLATHCLLKERVFWTCFSDGTFNFLSFCMVHNLQKAAVSHRVISWFSVRGDGSRGRKQKQVRPEGTTEEREIPF